jgi:hypothetical protein
VIEYMRDSTGKMVAHEVRQEPVYRQGESEPFAVIQVSEPIAEEQVRTVRIWEAERKAEAEAQARRKAATRSRSRRRAR